LIDYYPNPRTWFLFPGRHNKGHLHPDSAARILREVCLKLDIEGVSTHSFRRTALTQMSNAGIPLRVIQKISGHRSLGVLQEYLEVTPEQVRGAASSLSMLGYSDHNAPDSLNPLDWELDFKNEPQDSQPHTDWEEERVMGDLDRDTRVSETGWFPYQGSRLPSQLKNCPLSLTSRFWIIPSNWAAVRSAENNCSAGMWR